jgi:hypothetical protein
MLVGLCGREGAGKTTMANILCEVSLNDNDRHSQCDILLNDEVTTYLIDVLFPDWHDTTQSAVDFLLKLLREKVDSDYEFPIRSLNISYPPHSDNESNNKGTWTEYSMADPLKKAAAIIFDLDYYILKGDTTKRRILRESITTKNYNIAGVLTGRTCLEYLGTEVFRAYDSDFWIKLASATISGSLAKGQNIVIPDIRFPNELNMLTSLNGQLWVIYRNEKDLILTEQDQKQHPAKWTFLTFLDTPGVKKINNSGSLEDLKDLPTHMLLI